MRRFRLVLEYDGTDFSGFQKQPGKRCVQGSIELALREITGEDLRLVSAGRTDAGVHARGQVAHVDCATRLEPAELARALNARLPGDVAIRALEVVSGEFHARKSATGKLYLYRILNRGEPSALRVRYAWHVHGTLDLSAMEEAARPLIGTHDFSAFRSAPGGPAAHETSRRTLYRIAIARRGEDEVEIAFFGRSFLRQMVRNLVGTLVEVGQGKRPPEAMAEILASCDRGRAAVSAPAHGLCLERVLYDGDSA